MAQHKPPRKPWIFRLVVSGVLIVVFLGIGAVAGAFLLSTREEPPRREIKALAPLVESITVNPQDVNERFAGYATAGALRVANVAAEVPAVVVERVNDLRAGADVAEGQTLIRLDDREFRHKLDQVLALAAAEQASLDELAADAKKLGNLLNTAKRELRITADERTRVSRLFESEQAARKELDFANLAYQGALRVVQSYEREVARIPPGRARVEAAKRGYEAQAELAKLNIERCQIKAPFAGRVRDVFVEVGNHVAPGLLVVTIIDASSVEIPIQLPGAVYDRVRAGAACTVACDSMPGVSWRGNIARIAPEVDSLTRTFAAYVVVDNTKQARPLVPGTFVRAEVLGPMHRDGILIPRMACRDGRVLVAVDGVVRERPIVTRQTLEDQALVTGELHRGDRVIVSHLDQLAEGMPVRLRGDASVAVPSSEQKRRPVGASP